MVLVNLSFLSKKPTGISTYARNLYPYLKTLDPILLTPEPEPDYRCYPVSGRMSPDHGMLGHGLRLLWTQFRVPSLYRKLRTRLLFSPIPEAPIYSHCRYVVMVHDLIPLRFPNPRSRLSYYHRFILPQVIRQARHIICNSQSTANDVVEFFRVPAHRVTPIPLAYDHNHFHLLDLPTRTERPYFLYLGRQDPYKNVQSLIYAFAALPNRDEYELWLAGPTDQRYTPQCEHLTRELGIRDSVKFMEYVPYEKLPALLNQAIALVFPTLWEGFGLPVLEAMACGTPVITSNVSALPEVTGDAAILIDPYNVPELTAAMGAIATDLNLRDNLIQLGLLRASEFSWARTGQQTAEVLFPFT
ncbi:glycosyltransferase family 4 protein [Spirulina major]|uniref:glycosyltransferase family 4 protein n=1 Tax=Spirulina major TaxID=270636 RepID=UPI000ACE43DB|nr:glycosyltransferase family 1 protein [Spirulina major]